MTNLGQYDLLHQTPVERTQGAIERTYLRDQPEPMPSGTAAKPCDKRLLELWDEVFGPKSETVVYECGQVMDWDKAA